MFTHPARKTNRKREKGRQERKEGWGQGTTQKRTIQNARGGDIFLRLRPCHTAYKTQDTRHKTRTHLEREEHRSIFQTHQINQPRSPFPTHPYPLKIRCLDLVGGLEGGRWGAGTGHGKAWHGHWWARTCCATFYRRALSSFSADTAIGEKIADQLVWTQMLVRYVQHVPDPVQLQRTTRKHAPPLAGKVFEVLPT